jgi:4-hydroxy 2-oxovalerate aldolase
MEYLDCTIRDGGYKNNWKFKQIEVFELYKLISQSNINYFEIGFMRNKSDKNLGKWNSVSLLDIQKILNFHEGCKLAVMVPTEGNENFNLPKKEKSQIDLIRVHLRISNCTFDVKKIEDAFRISNNLIDCGHEVSLNLASANKLNNYFIDLICKKFSKINLKFLYLADTFGNLNEKTTFDMINSFKERLGCYGSSTSIGFHAHNNLENALSNSKIAIKEGVKIIDMSILGYGRGAGNLRSEFFALNQDENELNLLPLFKSCDILHPNKHQKEKVINAILGKLNIHPKYESLCKNKTIEESYLILKEIKNEK